MNLLMMLLRVHMPSYEYVCAHYLPGRIDSTSTRPCAHRFTDVCMCILSRWVILWVGSPRASCPFHHCGASAMSGGQARLLGLFKIVVTQRSLPSPIFTQLQSHIGSKVGVSGLTTPGSPVQLTVL